MITIATATNSNISFLSEDNYITTMKNKIQGTKREICKQPFCLSCSPMGNDKTKGERHITMQTEETRQSQPRRRIRKGKYQRR